jgi:hypothetical protein
VKQGRDLQPLGWPLTRLALVLALGAIAPLLDADGTRPHPRPAHARYPATAARAGPPGRIAMAAIDTDRYIGSGQYVLADPSLFDQEANRASSSEGSS